MVERCVVSRIDGKIKGPLGNRRSVDFRLLSAFKVETHNRRFPPLDEREIILLPLWAKICTPSCSLTAVSRMLMRLVSLVRLTARGNASDYGTASSFVAFCLNTPSRPAIGLPIEGKWCTKIPSLSPSFAIPSVPYLASDPLWTPRRL